MRDYRNDCVQEIKLRLSGLDPATLDKVVAAVTGTLNSYELTERCTDLVTYDTGNLQLMKTYAGNLLIDGKAKSTVEAYIREIRKFAVFIGNKDLKETQTFDIRNYLAQEKARGVSNRTAENSRSNLSAFFQWMTAEEYITKNPCAAVKPIKYTEEIRRPFSSVELDVLRSVCTTEKHRAIIEVLVSSGVRVGELINLNVEDVDFQKRAVHVRHGKGDKERITYIDSVASDHLIKYLTGEHIVSGALFLSRHGERYTTNGVRALLNKLSEQSGIPDVHPHRFRRTFATKLSARGMDIQEIQRLMGHTSINTTMVYITMDDTQVNNSYRKYSA